MRYYTDIDDEGISWTVYEYWTDTQCQAFRRRNGDEYSIKNDLVDFPMFFCDIAATGEESSSNIYTHDMGDVPFIPFANNNLKTSDLDNVKKLIDSYDKTYSGFVNDLEDVQQVIFVLTNYGGIMENGEKGIYDFLRKLKKYKTIPMDSAGTGDQSGLSTITIEIPVEARKELWKQRERLFFSMGQGIDPEQQSFDSTSGEAMKFLYSLLELKAGLMETEFRLGFGELVRAICRYHNKDVKNIIQTWTRNAIRSESELVDICSKSKGIISDKTIIKNHPLVMTRNRKKNRLPKSRRNSRIFITMKVITAKVVMNNVQWMKEYFTAFGKDFPFSKVADLNEYEIIRIIQYCVKTNTEYSDETEPEVKAAVLDTAKIGECTV